jgi:hypothetical protein
MQGEQPARADFDAGPARGAFRIVYYRQAVFVHYDSAEIADVFAVSERKTTPGTAFATAGDEMGGAARLHARVDAADVGYVAASRACEPGDALFFVARVDTQKGGDFLGGLLGTDGALAW